MARPKSVFSGFTIIELLVVISIISLMIALLLPALHKAQMAGRTVACMSNLRQQGIALHSYAYEESDSAMPYSSRWNAVWMIRIAPYLGGNASGYSGRAGVHLGLPPVDRNVAGLRCPENNHKPPKLYYFGNYGYNLVLTSGRPDLSPNHFIQKRRRTLNTLQAAHSKTVLTADYHIYNWIDGWPPFTAITVSSDDLVRRDHNGTLNFLMWDGHTENVMFGQRSDLMLLDGSSFGWF